MIASHHHAPGEESFPRRQSHSESRPDRKRAELGFLLGVSIVYGVVGWLNLILTLSRVFGDMLPDASVWSHACPNEIWAAVYALTGALMMVAAAMLSGERSGAWGWAMGLVIFNLITHAVFITVLQFWGALSVATDVLLIVLLLDGRARRGSTHRRAP